MAINLLPPAQIQALRTLRKKNLMLVLTMVCLAALLCLVLALIPVLLMVRSVLDYQKSLLSAANPNASSMVAIAQQAANDNHILKKAANFYQGQVQMSGAMERILSIPRPAGVTFNSLSLEEAVDAENHPFIAADIQGVSDSRDDLLAYRQAIEGSRQVTDSAFPADDWVDPSNISFTIHLEVPANVQ